MRPVRFVALSEDGQAFVLADEVGRLLALPLDERVTAAMRADRDAATTAQLSIAPDTAGVLSPRDIQVRSAAKPGSLYHHFPSKLSIAALRACTVRASSCRPMSSRLRSAMTSPCRAASAYHR